MPVGNVAAQPAVKVQVAMILDGSGSISTSEWDVIKEGVASAVENSSCLPDDGTVELTVVQFGYASGAKVEVGPVIITSANAGTVASQIRAMPKGDWGTPMAAAFTLAANTLSASPNFDPSIKQAINLATDGVPDSKANTETARNNAIATLQMTPTQDEIDAEGIGISNTNRDWLRDRIVYPQPGYIAPPFAGPGWVRVVADANEFAATVCEKFEQIVPDDWAEINNELDALIGNVTNATMPNIIKNRLIDKLEYAKALKDNAHEECLAGNFDAATKKLGVAKNQVESFASMVEITRRISPEDKASFLADATEIIEDIEKLIEHIETEDEC
jgi:hypothetical protein